MFSLGNRKCTIYVSGILIIFASSIARDPGPRNKSKILEFVPALIFMMGRVSVLVNGRKGNVLCICLPGVGTTFSDKKCCCDLIFLFKCVDNV